MLNLDQLPHFADEKAEAPGYEVFCPRSSIQVSTRVTGMGAIPFFFHSSRYQIDMESAGWSSNLAYITYGVTLRKLLNLFELQGPHLYNEHNTST